MGRLKTAIKASPLVYGLLLPAVTQLRRAVAALPMTGTNRFRRCCASIPRLVTEPVFVKVGANDGTTGDPCSDILLANPQWKGLLIEPVPYCFEALKANFKDPRRFTFEQVAIGSEAGTATFYFVDRKARDHVPGLPSWYDQLGSFDRAHITKHLDGVLEPFIVESPVEVKPLEDVLVRNGISDLQLLHIDTEGYDLEILKTLDLSVRQPLVIFVEHRHLPKAEKREMLALMKKAGYSVRDCGSDYFALDRRKYKSLQRNFRDRQHRSEDSPTY